jgi:hypothetical protein
VEERSSNMEIIFQLLAILIGSILFIGVTYSFTDFLNRALDSDLKKLSILTLVLVPLIPTLIVGFVLNSGPQLPMVGGALLLVFFFFVSVFFGIVSTIQLQIKRRLGGEMRIFVKISPMLSVMISLLVIFAYVLFEIDENVWQYGYGYIIFNRFAILFLLMPFVAILAAVNSVVNENRGNQLLINISYIGYSLTPILYFAMIWIERGGQ